MSDLMERFRLRQPLGIVVVDCHAHMGRWGFPVFQNGSAAAMLAEMDRFDVTTAAVAHHAVMGPCPSEAHRLAEAEIADSPGRFYLWCGFSPHYPDEGVQQLDRLLSDPRYVGIKLHPATHETDVDDPRYRPAFEFADAHTLPVLIHSWVRTGSRPELIAKVAANFPDARIILAHHGGGWDGHAEAIEACRTRENLYVDTCSSELVYRMVDRLTEALGADRVLFGSDLPFLSLGPQVGKILYARITDAEKTKVLGRSFLSMLRMRRGLPPVPPPAG